MGVPQHPGESSDIIIFQSLPKQYPVILVSENMIWYGVEESKNEIWDKVNIFSLE